MSSENHEAMRRVIRSFPVQINAGLLAKPPSFQETFSHILICGMGGSALAGRILKQYTRANGNHAVDIHDNYDLPPWVDATTLIVALSFSGNTEEVLSAFDKARSDSLALIAVSVGGELQKRAQESSTSWLKIPTPDNIPHFQPRHSIPSQLGLLVSLMSAAGLGDLREEFRKISDILAPDTLKEQAASLVEAIQRRTPIFYTSQTFSAVGYNWKIQLNETAKRHAFTSIIPEANHNELEAADHGHFHAVFLQSTIDQPRINRRIRQTEKINRDRDMKTTIVDLPGETSLEQHLNGILIGWWVAALMAEESGVNPLTVDAIEAFKKMLNE